MAWGVAEDHGVEDDEDIIHILHIIASHHGRLEYHSPVKPKTNEAWIVAKADFLDAVVASAPHIKERYGR